MCPARRPSGRASRCLLPRVLLVAHGSVLVFGVMNLVAMVALAAVVLAEKLWVHGEALARVVGVAALVLAGLVPWFPALTPGLDSAAGMSDT